MPLSSETSLILAAQVINTCLEQGKTISCAESCTGGLIASALTSVPGSSGVIKGGVVSYFIEAKEKVLGVPSDVIETYGVVSEEVAQAMAQQARKLFDTDFAVSTTGIAGPGGAEPGKPVGTVCIGIAGPNITATTTIHATGEREEVRNAAVEKIFSLLLTEYL